jgi:hypothetical protein
MGGGGRKTGASLGSWLRRERGFWSTEWSGREAVGTGPVAVDSGGRRWCCAIGGRGGHA